MASKLSEEQIKRYREMLAKAEPYPDDAPEMHTFDGDEGDFDRVRATLAKKILNLAGVPLKEE